jgi:lipopolysaccharide/colanic/teichoic acid biosynthesis glycosyltransferase
MLALERRRSERSRKPFLLMLLDTGAYGPPPHGKSIPSEILRILLSSTRETDVVGWYKDRAIVGVMFTEIVDEKHSDQKHLVVGTMLTRVSDALRDGLTLEELNEFSISLHLFPEEWKDEGSQRPSNPALYPDVMKREKSHWLFGAVKRVIDVAGSAVALVVLAPLFALIAAVIKLTSSGPAIFRQERLGRFRKTFWCLKFRTMYSDSDRTIHQEFMRHVINGRHEGLAGPDNRPIFKMKDDPRITPIGRFLRRTSLDELPQFLNVLRGEMSLVGPRPPLAYEYQEYEVWHRRRVIEVKPGITGLWQVKGRSRVRFDEMVRLDLQYMRSQSLWLDIKILLQTPLAVLGGDGAY